ncbi:MAG: ATP-binding protein [Sphingopyxis sp.]
MLFMAAMPSSFSSFLAAALVLIGGALVASAEGASLAAITAMIAAAGAAVIAVTFGRTAEPPLANAPRNNPEQVPQPLVPLHLHPGFDELIDALPVPLMIANAGIVVAANASARDLLGAFIVGADVRAAIRHPAAADRLDSQQKHFPDEAIDLVGIGHPGERWEMRAMPMTDGSLLVSLTNQTTRDAIERMRADFVANASHELRTPLSAILGYVETLLDDAAGSDAALRQRFLTIVDIEARRMLQLISDLMSISRIETSKGDLPEVIIDMAECTRTVIAELMAGGAPRAAAIICEESMAMVRGDRAQLSQLIHNLITNAMKYGRDGTPIMVDVHAASGMAELTVADQGEGIAAEHLPRLTERFYRVDSARSRALGGTGLGLAIAKHVVNRHRGRMEIDSVLGTGTTVRVRLPLNNS